MAHTFGSSMKRWHKAVFLILGIVLLFRLGQFAWVKATPRLTPSQQRYIALPCGYWLSIFPKNGSLYTICGVTLWVSAPGCYVALIGPNCFRDQALIGCVALAFAGLTPLVGWRRKSWKLLGIGLGLSAAYGWYFRPWRVFERIMLNPSAPSESLSRFYREALPWIWCMRCVVVAWMVALLLTVLVVSRRYWQHPASAWLRPR